MDSAVLRAWWFERQGLMEPGGRRSAEVLVASGWARTVGGANAYLTLFSRSGIPREHVDRDLENGELQELPSARGCTYLIPRPDFALALRVGQGFGEEAQVATARKFLGVTEAELERLAEKLLEALVVGPLDPRALKDAVGDAVRNLGAEGKKRGVTTTLPLALGRLQSAGHIRRIPVNGRVDQQRYRYALWRPSPLSGMTMTQPEALTELGRRYFRWIGPASFAHFQWFSGLGTGAARQALDPLELEPLEPGSDLLLLPEDREALASYRPPPEPHFALVAGTDGILLLRRDAASLVAEEDRERAQRLLSAGGLQDLPSHAILDRGRLVGLWEFDPGAGEIVWWSLVPRTARLQAAVDRMESYVRDQLGDARSYSLDSPDSRRPRIEMLRSASQG